MSWPLPHGFKKIHCRFSKTLIVSVCACVLGCARACACVCHKTRPHGNILGNTTQRFKEVHILYTYTGFLTFIKWFKSKGPFIHSSNANAFNANANANATFDQFCHSNKARTRTRKSVDGFRGDSSFTCLRYKMWSFGIMAQVYSDTEKIIVVYLYAKYP